jgi:metallo-beta-lactamase family protein
LRFVRESNLSIKKIALVHGEEEQALAFAETLRAAGYEVAVPYHGQSLVV